MKIYERVVIDMASMQVVEEVSMEYTGPVAEAKGGGGGGSAGGSLDLPTYMKDAHSDWMTQSGNDFVVLSMVDALNAAIVGGSPYNGLNAFDPSTEVAAINAEVQDYETLVDLLSTGTGLDELVENVLDETRLTAAEAAFNAEVDDEITNVALPRFQAGMRDINAVVSSSFAIGQSHIENQATREKAKYSSQLRLNAFGPESLQVIQLKLEAQRNLAQTVIEASRIAVVAQKEQIDRDAELAALDLRWDLDSFQPLANMLAAASGGVGSVQDRPSPLQSALGGAMSGAAAGAMIGGPWGAAAGGLLGAASSLL